MYTVYSILVKPKYTIDDVINVHEMCKKYLCGDFEHYCLTDDIAQFEDIDFCTPIDVSLYDLQGFWFKILLFKEGFCKPGSKCIFFDLDSKILKPIEPLLQHIDGRLFLGVNPDKFDSSYVNRVLRDRKGKYMTMVNSSLMMWIGGDHKSLWDKFNEDPDYYMLMYPGNDEFLTFEYDCYDIVDHKNQQHISISWLDKQKKSIFWLK